MLPKTNSITYEFIVMNQSKSRIFYLNFRYETGTLLLSDVNCQRRAVCEIYKYKKELGKLAIYF